MVPTLQLYINPTWNRQDLAQRAELRSRSQSWRHQMPDDSRIEGVSRYAESGITDNAARGSAVSNSRANVNQGEVARTTPEVPNKNEFIVIERRLVIMCGSDRLHLELYGFVPGRLEGRSQSTLRIVVIFLVLRSDKMNRP